MEQEHHRAFGPFHLDGTQGRLWQGDQHIALEDGRARLMAVHPCVSCSHVGGGRVCSGREGDRPSARPVGRLVHLQSASAKNACVLPSSRHPTVYRLKNSVRVFTSETATSSRSAGPSRAPLGFLGVVAHADLEGNGQLVDLDQLLHEPVDRHGPLVVLPIVRGFRVHPKGRELFRRIGQKRLQERAFTLSRLPSPPPTRCG